MTKPEVRSLAAELGLQSAHTPDSQEICFIPEGQYTDFLKRRVSDAMEALQPGELYQVEDDKQLTRLGEHEGFAFYTVGQRKGLGGGFPTPRYVLSVEPETRRVLIGTKEKLQARTFVTDQVNWLIDPPAEPDTALIQIRYRSEVVPGRLNFEGNVCKVELEQSTEAIAPGQSAVFYQGERVIGGGRIVRVEL